MDNYCKLIEEIARCMDLKTVEVLKIKIITTPKIDHYERVSLVSHLNARENMLTRSDI